jgi:hypothetical protein
LGPTASRNVPISFSMAPRISTVGAPSVVLMPLLKPGKYTVAGSPGITMLVFKAVKPFATTSRPSAAMSS